MHRLRRFLFLVFLCFESAGVAHADELLAEITFQNDGPIVAPAQYIFNAFNSDYSGLNYFAAWRVDVTQFDTTVWASPEQVADFDRIWTSFAQKNSQYMGIANGPYSVPGALGKPLDSAFAGVYAHEGLTATRYVPRLDEFGWGLSYYDFTAIERLITPMSQTIRFYGIPGDVPASGIPEPCATTLGLIAVIMAIALQHRSK